MKEFIEKLISRLYALRDAEIDNLCNSDEEETADDGEQIFESGRSQGRYEQTNQIMKIVNQLAEEYNNGWIPCSERLPEEHESIFARYKGTDKWIDGMFEKISDDVMVTVEFENGERKTMTLHTFDGEWNTRDKIVKVKVIAWQPLPEPLEAEE